MMYRRFILLRETTAYIQQPKVVTWSDPYVVVVVYLLKQSHVPSGQFIMYIRHRLPT